MNNGTTLEAALQRDRAIVLAALFILVVLAWSYLAWIATGMQMPAGSMSGSMPGNGAMPMDTAAGMPQSWGLRGFVFTFAMWSIMMVGMMVPSAAPMILIYARVARRSGAQDTPLASTGSFAAGYLLAWTAFSLAAATAQWSLHRTLLLTPGMASASAALSGLLLVAAGIYQWTPLKRACLRNCQMPLAFLQRHGGFGRTASDSVALGFRHGSYCVGCCWALMALLFVLGVMNLAWVAILAVFVLAEKVLPPRWHVDRVAGSCLLAAGCLTWALPL